MDLGKPTVCTKFEVVIFSRYRNIKEEASNFRGASLAQGHTHFFFQWDFMMGLGKPQRHAEFEVAGFVYYGNTTECVFKRQIRI